MRLKNINGVVTFLVLTAVFSAVFYTLIIISGRVNGGNQYYVLGLMWCPGWAALLTLQLHGRSFTELGWRLGPWKLLIVSYALPIVYALFTYVPVWLIGYEGFPNMETVHRWSNHLSLGNLPVQLVIGIYFVLSSTLGLVRTTGALGEEIGWRGFLVPELLKSYSYTQTSLITGVIWAIYHYPILIFADYNMGTPIWFGLICFTVMIVSSCFIYTWLRIRSGSLWPAAILHASHNLFIQAIFTPLTATTGYTNYLIDEFGIGLMITTMAVGFYFWTRRNEL